MGTAAGTVEHPSLKFNGCEYESRLFGFEGRKAEL
jgi:hypothetical protein